MITMKKSTYRSIIKAAGIERGDLVLIQYWMGENFSDDIAYIQAEIAAIGASPVLVVQNLALSQLLNENVTADTYGDRFFDLYENADVVIDVMERPVGVLSKQIAPEKMELLANYMSRLFQICSGKKKMLQLRVPTAKMAQADGLDPEDYRTRVEAALDIDYEHLARACFERREQAEKNKGIVITTKDGACNLELSFEGRSWEVDAGDGDLPCGEIFIAPVEGASNGTVFFRTIYLPNPDVRSEKLRFENVTLTVCEGVIVGTSDERLTAVLKENGKENSTICEFGLGMNPGVTSLCGCEFLDEKMTGTFHLGIGDNIMFGGEIEADEHHDFIGTGELNWKE